MIEIDLKGKAALITGGTKGIGLAAAVEFSRAGARTYLTYKWGSADERELSAAFAETGGPQPVLFRADVSKDEDTVELMAFLKSRESRIDFFISNVGVARRVRSLRDYRKRSLIKTLDYSAWPLIEYTRRIRESFGSFPSHILGISSDGPDHFYPGYDFVAASKALLETFARYLSVHLSGEGSRVNVIRFGPVNTQSFSLIFGQEFFEYLKENGIGEELFMTPRDCGKAVLALCSGLLDAVNGQVISIDKGLKLQDSVMTRFLAGKASD